MCRRSNQHFAPFYLFLPTRNNESSYNFPVILYSINNDLTNHTGSLQIQFCHTRNVFSVEKESTLRDRTTHISK